MTFNSTGLVVYYRRIDRSFHCTNCLDSKTVRRPVPGPRVCVDRNRLHIRLSKDLDVGRVRGRSRKREGGRRRRMFFDFDLDGYTSTCSQETLGRHKLLKVPTM